MGYVGYVSFREIHQHYLAHIETLKREAKERMAVAEKSAKIVHLPAPLRCSPRWRAAMLDLYPALDDAQNEQARTYRRMVEYVMCSQFFDWQGRLVMPAEAVSYCAGKAVGSGVFSAIEVLNSFCENVWDVGVSDYIPCRASRTILPVLPDAVVALGSHRAVRAEGEQAVWWVTGKPVSPSSRRREAERYQSNLRHLVDEIVVGEDHPARELLAYLNEQAPHALNKVVRSNMGRLWQMYDALPADLSSRTMIANALEILNDDARLVYAPAELSCRLHAVGTNLHGLPRSFRKTALAGAIEMDIRSSQLAIVAKLWDLPLLTAFLVSGKSIWVELMSALQLDAGRKDVLKSAVYATCFAMSRRKLEIILMAGGLTREQAAGFLRHPLIRELLLQRNKQIEKIRQEGGVRDAYGRWYAATEEHPAYTLLSIQAQSWELRLMLSVFDVVRQNRDTSILSWLHDGVVISTSDRRPDRIQTLLNATKTAFDQQASALGFATELEQEVLI